MTPTGPKELIRLEIPALPAFVGVARVVVASVATTVDGIDDGRLEDLRIAVSEACTNAVEVHLAEGRQKRVVLRCVLDGDALEIHIEDSGSGFGDGGDPDHGRVRGAEEDAERGWGLQLIRALVDDVEFSSADGGTGTSVRLVVRRDGDA
ncbi:MAG: ATP-binding protein [Acidimicrobiales bacterium]